MGVFDDIASFDEFAGSSDEGGDITICKKKIRRICTLMSRGNQDRAVVQFERRLSAMAARKHLYFRELIVLREEEARNMLDTIQAVCLLYGVLHC